MPNTTRYGRPAAPGLAIGTLCRPGTRVTSQLPGTGSPAAERRLFEAAIAAAADSLEAMMLVADRLGAAMFAAQATLMRDGGYVERVLAEIEAGQDAANAWRAVMDAEIERLHAGTSAASDDEAGDLADLRERVLRCLGGKGDGLGDLPADSILVARSLPPSQFLAVDWRKVRGLALEDGSPASHVAVLARARGVPMVTGLGTLSDEILGHPALIDGERGQLVTNPSPDSRAELQAVSAARKAQKRPDMSRMIHADGSMVSLMVNVDDPSVLDPAALALADGCGLVRTEFFFAGAARLPDEEGQRLAYEGFFARLGGRSCIVRTFDVGSDNPLPGQRLAQERNPQLGLRGVRLGLQRPELLRVQFRAMLRAARGHDVKIMLPMVSHVGEFLAARAHLERARAELEAEGHDCADLPLGITVETPAAALLLNQFIAAGCAFASIGSNDLAQYTMAASRDGGRGVAELLNPLSPAVLQLIELAVTSARRCGTEIGLCGDIAGDPDLIPILLRLGLRQFSVGPAMLAATRRCLQEHCQQEASAAIEQQAELPLHSV